MAALSIVLEVHGSCLQYGILFSDVSIGRLSGLIWVLIGLHAFGWFFDWLVSRAKPAGYLEPYTALWVAAGVLITILGMGAISLLYPAWNAAPVALLAFFATGIPMIIGDAIRYVRSIQSAKAAERRPHDAPETLAK